MTQPYYQPPQETIYYQDPSPVFISSVRVILANQTFVMRNIGSVAMVQLPPSRTPGIVLVVVGLVIGLIGARGIALALSSGAMLSATIFLVVGLGIITLGCSMFFIGKPIYALLIGSMGGQIKTITSQNPEYISHLVSTINWVISTH
jgi:hypothetical protein